MAYYCRTFFSRTAICCHEYCGSCKLVYQFCCRSCIPNDAGKSPPCPGHPLLALALLQRYFENYSFLPFSGFLAVFWIFCYNKVPETKNRSFEEISILFQTAHGDSGSLAMPQETITSETIANDKPVEPCKKRLRNAP